MMRAGSKTRDAIDAQIKMGSGFITFPLAAFRILEAITNNPQKRKARMAQAMRTHTGEIVTGNRLNEARKYAAGFERRSCRQWLTNPDYGAAHVTTSQRGEMAAMNMRKALQTECGERDHNFTVWQRMDCFLTGTSVPFLSN